MAKEYAIGAGKSSEFTRYLKKHPKELNSAVMSQGMLVDEIGYYIDMHRKAKHPVAQGVSTLDYDGAMSVLIDNGPYEARLIGIRHT